MLSVPAAAQFGAVLLAVGLAAASTGASASTTPGVAPNYTFPDGSTLAPVPEAAAWTLMLIGVGGVGGLARARTQAARAGAGCSASCSEL